MIAIESFSIQGAFGVDGAGPPRRIALQRIDVLALYRR
jgi:hypothetical protein